MARMLATPRPRRAGSLPAGLIFLALAPTAAAPGCSSGMGIWGIGRDKSLTRDVTKEEYRDAVAGNPAGDERSRLMARWLETGQDGAKAGPPNPFRQLIGLEKKPKPVATAEEESELKAAQELAKAGKYAEALPALTKIARRNKGGDLAEVALFFKGECQFQTGDYVGASYTFEELGKDFPTSRYLEKAVQREYAIGTFWLASVDGLKLTPTPPPVPTPSGGAKADGEVKLASTAPAAPLDPTPVAPPHLPKAQLGIRDHFTGTLPTMDVAGTAIRVLEKVRHHDPTGPLADDAVLLIARYHDANMAWDEASLKYEELINDNPKSPLVQTAQLEAIDARIKSYVGPQYEGAGLEQARAMVEDALSTVPPDKTKVREHLYVTLDVLREVEAERAFVRAEFYQKLGRATSAEYMFAMIPQKWPKSPWAAKAKERLSQIAAIPRKESLPSKIMTTPGAPDPYTQGVSPNGMGNNMSLPY